MPFNIVYCQIFLYKELNIFCISNERKVNKTPLTEIISWIIQVQFKSFKNINVNMSTTMPSVLKICPWLLAGGGGDASC